MLIKSFATIAFVFYTIVVFSTNSIDSLKIELNKAKDPSDSINILLDLSKKYYSKEFKNNDSLSHYSLYGLELAEKVERDSAFYELCSLHAISFFYSDTTKFFQYMQKGEAYALKKGKPKRAARFVYYQGTRRLNFKQTPQVLALMERGLNLLNDKNAEPLNDKDKIMVSRILGRSISALTRSFKFEEALDKTKQLQKLAYDYDLQFAKLESYISFIDIYSQILENISFKKGQQNKIKYDALYLNAIDSLFLISKESKDSKIQARHAYSLNCYGDYYYSQNETSKAIDYYQAAVDYSKSNVIENVQFTGLIGLINSALIKEEAPLAKKYLNEAEELVVIIKNSKYQLQLNELWLDYYQLTDDKVQLQKYYSLINQRIDELPKSENYLSLYEKIYPLALDFGDYKTAFEKFEFLSTTRDSIKIHKLATALEDIQAKYELTSKNEQINLLKKESLAAQLKLSRVIIISIIALILALSTLAFFVVKNKISDLKNKRKEAELKEKLLRSHMDPHFTFNILSATQSFIHRGQKDEANEFIGLYSRLVRKNLSFTSKDRIPFNEEKTFLESYLDLEQKRRDGLFEFNIQIKEDQLKTSLIPPLFIQPLIENAIKHGFKNMHADGVIDIHFEKASSNILCVTVSDNGKGYDPKVKENHESIGLNLIKERLSILNRNDRTEAYKLDLKSKVNPTQFKLYLPLYHD